MTYTELDFLINDAWCQFFNHLRINGVNPNKVEKEMDRKDVFNSVSDCVVNCVGIERDEEK